MDSFRTRIPAPSFPFRVSHESKVVLLGSCFAESVGEKLSSRKFDVVTNPFGILFNPFSIVNALERMLNNRPYVVAELEHVDEHWVSLDHHGAFKRKNSDEALSSMNDALESGRKQLLASNVIFITLGSAWVYRHLTRDHIVANCHKIPNNKFKKELLSFQEAHLIMRQIPQFLASMKINAQLVFTVSPVRHWKDGPIENNRSKSILNSAIHEVVDEFENCHYFPSYEYMMDDLRDYRFYGADMLHPTAQTVDYIWQKFQESLFEEETVAMCKAVSAVVEAASHRPMDPESNSYQRFLKKQLEIIEDLDKSHPELNMSEEKARFGGLIL